MLRTAKGMGRDRVAGILVASFLSEYGCLELPAHV